MPADSLRPRATLPQSRRFSLPLRRYDVRWLVVYLANLMLWWLVGLANSYAGKFSFLWIDYVSLHFYLGGLFVVYSALRLDQFNGLVAVVLTALTIDAGEPVPYGTSLVLLGLVHATLLYGRQRFPREEAVFGIVVALLTNLFLIIVLSFMLVGANPHPGEAWFSIFVDLVASQALLVLITPWFLALQDRAMQLAGIHPETGRRAQI